VVRRIYCQIPEIPAGSTARIKATGDGLVEAQIDGGRWFPIPASYEGHEGDHYTQGLFKLSRDGLTATEPEGWMDWTQPEPEYLFGNRIRRSIRLVKSWRRRRSE
jgi:hypothetical protein